MTDQPTIVVGFTGAATLRAAHDIADRLRAALAAGGGVELDCEGLEEVDLTFVQLVVAARKSAEAEGKRLVLGAPARGPLLAALEAAGIGPVGSQRFWFGNGGE